MAPKTKQIATYAFVPEFERQVVFYTCARPRFHGVVGYVLDPEAMPSEAGKLAVQAAHAIARDLGRGPDSPLFVLQRLRLWMEDGKCTLEKIQAVSDMLDQAEDAGLLPEESIVSELAPMLKERVKHEVVVAAMSEYSQKSDMGKVVSLIEKANRIGINDSSIGTKVGTASFQVIESMNQLDRLPTGVLELDSYLSGGMPRGQLGMFIGGPGDGKSMALNHICAAGWLNGLFCGYASLELPDPIVLARLKSNVTGIPIDAILDGSLAAKKKIESLPLGTCIVKSFTPQATTVGDLRDWVRSCEDAEGRRMDLLVVDYADKLVSRVKSDEESYTSMRAVYETLRYFTMERGTWTWTASQSSRSSKDQKKKVDLEHVADSLHKVRVADLVVTLNARDEGQTMMFYIAKNRTGKSRMSVGPLPVDFSCGAMSYVARRDEAAKQEPGWLG